MSIPFSCPHCGKSMAVENQFAGQTGPCSGCGQTITIPAAGTVKPSGAGLGALSAMAAMGLVGVVVCLGIGGIIAALLLPAMTSTHNTSQRISSQNNLKQIVLAMHNYHDVHQSFPPAFVADADGQPLYSWRVLILPYLEQQALFDRFDKSKAWDAPENIAISNTMLDVYRSPLDPVLALEGTNYFVLIGPQTVFTGDTPLSMAAITDGTSNTIAVVELQGISGSWAAPIDPHMEKVSLSIGPGINQLNSTSPEGMNAAFCDGSVRLLQPGVSPGMLNLLFLRNDGQAVMVPE